MSDEKIRNAIVQLLGERALPVDEIAVHLLEQGVITGDRAAAEKKVLTLLQLDTRFSRLTGGFVHMPTLLEGTSWTVWVDPTHAADGCVHGDPHLAPLIWWLIASDVDLVDADGKVLGPLETDGIVADDREVDAIFGPEGWLDDLAGGWARAEVIGGAMRWSSLAEAPAPTPRQLEAVRAGYQVAAEDDGATADGGGPNLRYAPLDDPIEEALLIDRDAFVGTPIPPLPELYAAAGLELRDRTVAEPGFDWDALQARRHRNRLAITYGLDHEQVDRLIVVTGACLAFLRDGLLGPDVDGDERAGAAAALAHLLDEGPVAEAFYAQCGRLEVGVHDLQRFVDTLIELLGGAVPAGLGWLQAQGLDLLGDARAADQLLRALATPACDHEPLLLTAAAFASDRGDAVAAYRLLRQAGVLDRGDREDEYGVFGPDEADRLADQVAPFALHRPRATAGRNDPCPCGSGRKYKACHLGREQHPLADRASWLFEKAARFARTREGELVDELADMITEHMPRLRREVAGSGFIVDLVLHEGRLLDDFLAARSMLLPDDEALLAAQWSLVDRSVFEVRRNAGDRLELRNIATGDDVTVVNVTPGPETRPGTIFVGRPLPVGDTYRAFSGFIPIPRARVDAMLDAILADDPHAVATVIADTLRPPRLQNTDGEDMVLHTITWSVTDPTAVGAALEAAGFESHQAGEWQLTRGGAGTTILASLRLDGDRLVGDVNSAARAAALVQRVEDALPQATLLDTDRMSMDEAMERRDATAMPSRSDVSADDPAMAAALADFMAEQERRWCDEHIPALGGRTPREAMQDPIGREELEQLLASFPDDPSDFGAMSATRLRQLLGL